VLFAAYAATLGVEAAGGSRYAGAEPHHLLAAASLADGLDLDLADEYARGLGDRWTAGGRLRTDGRVVAGRLVEPHGLGFGLLLAPAYALGGATLAVVLLAAVAALAFVVSWAVSRWYKGNMHLRKPKPARAGTAKAAGGAAALQTGKDAASYVWLGMGLLILLTFARSTYHAAILNYYQYFYAEKYASTIEAAQLPLFLFGVVGVVGTLVGGPLADRLGSRRVIFGSMAGAAPFAMLLPYVGEAWVIPIMFVVGFILMLGFSVVVVYAQLLMPNHIGTASGLIVGLAFGMGALGAVALGYFIDLFGLQPVFVAASLLPLIGIVTFKLPDLSKQ